MTKHKDPRHGNPSDPAEEAERVRKAHENLTKWQDQYGGFSGGVSMQMGSGRKYEVPIGNPEIAQKIVSRPLPPKVDLKTLTAPTHEPLDPRFTTPETAVRSLGIDPHFAAEEPKPAPSMLRRISVFLFGERS